MQKLKKSTEFVVTNNLDMLPRELQRKMYPGFEYTLLGHRFTAGGMKSLENALTPEHFEELHKNAELFYVRCLRHRQEFGVYPEYGILQKIHGNYASASGIINGPNQKLIPVDLFSFSNETELIIPELRTCIGRLITKETISKDNLYSLWHFVIDEFEHKVNVYPRVNDTEYKIFEFIFRQIQLLGISSSDFKIITGQIILESERSICESCNNVINNFKLFFPKIEIIVRSYYGGDHAEYQPNKVLFRKDSKNKSTKILTKA